MLNFIKVSCLVVELVVLSRKNVDRQIANLCSMLGAEINMIIMHRCNYDKEGTGYKSELIKCGGVD